jgi:hypothetical protein
LQGFEGVEVLDVIPRGRVRRRLAGGKVSMTSDVLHVLLTLAAILLPLVLVWGLFVWDGRGRTRLE